MAWEEQPTNEGWLKTARPWAYQFLYARFGGWTAKAMPKYYPALKWLKKTYFTDFEKFMRIVHGTKTAAGHKTEHL